ncbi:hypothetical protein LTR08_001228 [Meristemomyces frigidus]|nr:hypothetical protein LTR08_001228 [Meristemomyces frigidus]
MRSLAALPVALVALLSANLAATAAQDTTTFTTNGLQINVTHAVACSRPSQKLDSIAVHYKGTLQATGAEFDESYRRGAPFTFVLGVGRVIKGWDLGLVGMCPGDKRVLTIPPELGYGSRGQGSIPGGSTLVFETELVGIKGVVQEEVIVVETTSAEAEAAMATVVNAVATSIEEGAFGIATAPPTPTSTSTTQEAEEKTGLIATPLDVDTDVVTTSASPHAAAEEGQAECHLLGPFALLVQAALGGVAILSLVWKRYFETSKRPWKIFFFDVSKQVFGSMLTHALNLAMSMLGSVDVINAAATVAAELEKDIEAGAAGDGEGLRVPNPCSFYLLNLGIDTTIGIPVLYILLKILHALFLHTPLARPRESIKSGYYGHPPRATWWIKQSLLYFMGLVGMKIFVFFLFAAMPWLPWVGDWALRWTKGNEAVEVVFVMFVFPLVMNVVQYWIIDSFIMERNAKDGKGKGKGGYEQVHGDDDEERRQGLIRDDDGSVTEVDGDEDGQGRAQVTKAPLQEVNPTPIPDR